MDEGPRLLGARRLTQLLDQHGVRPSKSLGQNFVIDPNTIRKVVRAAKLRSDDRVLEIGAGCGSLTVALADAAAHVTAVELDPRLVPVLHDVVGDAGNVDVVVGDALAMDLSAISASRLVANLPYNVAAQIVLRVLEEAPQIGDLTVMTQREVGERLAARPGSKAYGITSVLIAYWGAASIATRISRHAFLPVPNVDSVLVRVVRSDSPPEIERAVLFDVIRSAFSQRRKTVRNALAPLAGSAETAGKALVQAGLPHGVRAEELGLEDFVALSAELTDTLRSERTSEGST